MKFTVPSFKVGQRVFARVEEVVSKTSLIVNFNGDLLRLENHTGRRIVEDEMIELEIRAVEPLRFQLVSTTRTNRIDYSV